jgi:alkylation response protein AidB-like acyl-CoA dehydrogenase
MDLSLSNSEQLLQASARSFVAREATIDAIVGLQDTAAGCRPEWIRAMADAGWLGLLVPADCGGVNATSLEAALVVEELGRGAVPGPFLFSSVVSALLLRVCRPTPARRQLLAGIATGEVVLAPALLDPQRDWAGLRDVELELSGDADSGYLLKGRKAFVPFVDAATHLLVAARRPGAADIGFAVVAVDDNGVTRRRLEGFLAWNYEVSLDEVAVESQFWFEPENAFDSIDDACDRANAIVSAYQVGGAQTLLDRSIGYSNSREQFGQPIGRFQRVQDHIVGLLNALDTARWATYEALWQLDSGAPARAGAHLAKAMASESYFHCANAAHEVHAGIGSDPSFGLTLFTQMSRSLYDYLGSPRWHKRKMADALLW